MNLAQAVDPETGRLPAERVAEGLPRVAPWGAFTESLPVSKKLDLPDVPVLVRPRDRKPRDYSGRRNGAGTRALLAALRKFDDWADLKRLRLLLPMMGRNKLKLYLMRSFRSKMIQRRGTAKRFQYRASTE